MDGWYETQVLAATLMVRLLTACGLDMYKPNTQEMTETTQILSFAIFNASKYHHDTIIGLCKCSHIALGSSVISPTRSAHAAITVRSRFKSIYPHFRRSIRIVLRRFIVLHHCDAWLFPIPSDIHHEEKGYRQRLPDGPTSIL